MDKLNKNQKIDITHQAISQAQVQLDKEQKEDIIAQDSPLNGKSAFPQLYKEDVQDVLGESTVNLNSHDSVERSKWPQDGSQDEVNTEGWDIEAKRQDGKGSKYLMKNRADSPFQIYQAEEDPDNVLSKEEIEQQQTDEIVNLYQKKDSQHPKIIQKKKKSFFEELWEKDHPQEAAEEKQKEEEKKRQEKVKKE